MKSLRDEMEIGNAYELVGTYRAAAALCGTTAKTVKRVLERSAAGQVGRRPSPAHLRNTASVVELIVERVRASDGRISAKRLLPVARKAGYRGSARNFRRAVAGGRSELAKTGSNVSALGPRARPLSGRGLGRGRRNVFCAVLAWSHVRFVRFGPDQRRATTLALLAECFE